MTPTWYQLGSLYSNNFKSQSSFMSKLYKFSNKCEFNNPKEIIKFINECRLLILFDFQ